ncbi:MAG: hypothetical protein ACK5QE_07490 [Sphingobacteriia bacterium]|jgi:hypothetical protein
MQAIITELSARLQQLGLRYVDRYNGQPETNVDHLYTWPAAFIELHSIQWRPRMGRYQSGAGNITLHLIQQHLGDSHTTAEGQEKAKLSTYTLVDQVADSLRTYRGTHVGELQLIQSLYASHWNQYVYY